MGLLVIGGPHESQAVGAMAVFDVQAFATLKDVFKTSLDSLTRLQELSSNFQTLNRVMGGKLPEGFLKRFQAFDTHSHAFSNLLQAVTQGDPLQGFNRVGVQYGGVRDFSNYLYAKAYMQDKFFPSALAPRDLETVQAHKNAALQTATIDGLALATQQKKTLPQDHQTLQHITQEGQQHDSLQYQLAVQTKVLEQIAHRLDKLILLQAQQLELAAAAHVQQQPSLYRGVGGTSPNSPSAGAPAGVPPAGMLAASSPLVPPLSPWRSPMILFLFFFALCHPLTVLATVDPTAGLPAAVPIQPLTENPDIEAQLKGDYPPLDRPGGGDDGPDPFSPPATLDDLAQRRGAPLSGASLPLGAIQQAWNHAGPQAGVYQVTYHPHEVIRLRCRELMTTTLVFPSWERLDILRVGDPASFKVDHPQPHLLLLQPQAFMGVDTTLLAVGASGKVYTFYLRAEGYNTKHVPDVTVYIRVPKPAELLITKEQLTAEAVDYLEEATFEPEKLSFRFDMRGDASIAPQRVYADGIRTWFDYGDSIGQKDLPAVYRVIDGVDTPLNATRQGTKLMVAQGTGAFTLISGQKVVCITPHSQEKP